MNRQNVDLVSDAESLHASNALDRLMVSVTPRLWGYILSRVSDPFDAQDILQEVSLALVKSWRSTPPKNALSFIYCITRNKISDHYRKKRSDVSLSDHPDIAGPDRRGESERLLSMMRICHQAGLTKEQLQALVLFHYAGSTLNEMSQVLKISPSTLHSRIRHARRKLKDYFARRPAQVDR